MEEQQQEPPTPPTFAPGTSPGVLEQLEQSEGVSPGFSERQQPLTRICPVGNVWDPSLMICVPDVPPIELCPDGSIPQPTGPGGTQPECPPSEAQQLQAEEPEQTPAEEPEQPEAQEEPQEQPSDGGGEEQSDQEDQQQSSEDGSGAD